MTMHKPSMTVHLDALPAHLWHAVKHTVEIAVAPLLLFYLLFEMTGMHAALLAALGWVLTALVVRLILRVRIPVLLLITAGFLVARTVVGYVTQSTFLYFLEPTVQNFVFAFVLLVTLPFERTFFARLADDFCAFPPALTSNARVQRFFRRVSLLWALVFTVNGLASLWALAEATLGGFVMVTTVGSYGMVGLALGISLLWFRWELRGAGIHLRFGRAPALSESAA
jgi:hypothetical protein